jgi:SAM-dependent methyltransferase
MGIAAGTRRDSPGTRRCHQKTVFVVHDSWLRDAYLCGACNSIPRQRHVQHILDTWFPGWEDVSIHESSPSNDFVERHCHDYSSSHYRPDLPPGTVSDGVRTEDLESLTYPDATFDLFITQDVLEHVFHPDRALAEIMRVLRPGGAHVFTTPKHRLLERSRPRAVIVDGELVLEMEAEYHGNPIGDGRSLVTWDYGDDFEQLIHRWTGLHTTTYVTRDRSIGLDGQYLEVFVTRKP